MTNSDRESRPRPHTAIMLSAAAAVAALDQAAKWWALTALDDGAIVPVVWTLRLRLVFNKGSAFGQFQGLGPLLGVAAVVVAVALLRARRLTAGRPASLAAGSVAGGALGNFCDRVFRSDDGLLSGSVVDFIDVQWWPVWNVADMGIVVGGAALAWSASRRQP